MNLQEFENLVKYKDCHNCGGPLGSLEHYDHSGGWEVEGFASPQWLYKTCRRCGYQWALWKLGVKR